MTSPLSKRSSCWTSSISLLRAPLSWRGHSAGLTLAAAATGVMFLAAQSASADIFDWTDGTADYGTAANWQNENAANGNRVPTNGDIANIANGGTVTIGAGETYSADEVWTGQGGNGPQVGNGNFQMTGGTLTVNNWFVVGRVGDNAVNGVATFSGGTINKINGGNGHFIVGEGQATGMFTMSDTATTDNSGTVINNTGEMWIGNASGGAAGLGTGTFNMQGGTINQSNWLAIGRFGNTTGTLNLSGGVINKTSAGLTQRDNFNNAGNGVNDYGRNINSGNFVTLNTAGQSLITQTGGTFNNSASATWIAEGGGTNATYNISGGTAMLGVGNVGRFGNGTLTVSGTAVVTAGTFGVGFFDNAVGTVNMSGGSMTVGFDDTRIGGAGDSRDVNAVGTFNMSGGTFTSTSFTQIGAFGKGTLNQTGGTFNTTSFTDAGRFAGSVGVIDVEGGVFNQMNGGNLFAGEEGTGTITVGGTGTINSDGGLVIGQVAGAVGTVNLNTGGTLSTPFVHTNGGTSTFNFNGGTLVARGASTAFASATFFTGVQTVNVLAGGARVDTNAFDATITQALIHGGAAATDGGLTKLGAGNLTLTAANTFTGATNLAAGTLTLSTGTIASTAASVANGATLTLGANNANNNALPDNLTLSLVSGATLNLNAAGGTETINILLINGSAVTPGTYAATALNGMGGITVTSGFNETLTVTAVPEPSTWALGLMGLAGLAGYSQRRRVSATWLRLRRTA